MSDPTAAEPIADHPGAPLARNRDGWLEITLNRPAEHNRIDPADLDALLPLIESVRAGARGMRALLLTGAGEQSFSSGYTLQAIEATLDDRYERLLDTLEALPLPTIAVLNGSVYGGATDLALCCDIRIGVPGIRMLVPAARVGIHYYPGGLRRYVTRLGLQAASRLMLAAMPMDADEMLRVGFLAEIVERDERAALARSMAGAYQASLRAPELGRRLAELLGRKK